MEHIRKAVERAKESHTADFQHPAQIIPHWESPTLRPNVSVAGADQLEGAEVTLSGAHLESKRIISHDIADLRSKFFDMLRTQILQTMDMKSWQLLAVTSPTAGCGKTTIAANLALSIARQPERSVLLVDMDLQKPQVANHLGLSCDQGLVSVLEGRTKLSTATIRAHIRNSQLTVLPCETSIQNSSEWMGSRQMSAVLQEIRRNFRSSLVILDLPPILTSDDVITILPQIDCVLFVAAAGSSTLQDVKECNKHLQSASIVRVVLNKVPETGTAYYY